MELLLKPELADRYFLSLASNDQTIIIPFNQTVREIIRHSGDKNLAALLKKIQDRDPREERIFIAR